MAAARVEHAPAKVNLTLAVVGRRADGYHDIESLVVFAAVGDTLEFTPGRELALTVRGPTARAGGLFRSPQSRARATWAHASCNWAGVSFLLGSRSICWSMNDLIGRVPASHAAAAGTRPAA